MNTKISYANIIYNVSQLMQYIDTDEQDIIFIDEIIQKEHLRAYAVINKNNELANSLSNTINEICNEYNSISYSSNFNLYHSKLIDITKVISVIQAANGNVIQANFKTLKYIDLLSHVKYIKSDITKEFAILLSEIRYIYLRFYNEIKSLHMDFNYTFTKKGIFHNVTKEKKDVSNIINLFDKLKSFCNKGNINLHFKKGEHNTFSNRHVVLNCQKNEILRFWFNSENITDIIIA